MSKVAVLGSGIVGQVLADGFLKHGYSVMRATREPSKLAAWQSDAGPKATVGTFAEAAKFGDLVVLAVKGTAAEQAVELAGPQALAGKTVIDATNPIADEPPVNGVLKFFTGPNESLLERLARRAPDAHFVKAFSSVGSVWMVNPDFGGVRPTMFICGDHAAAKKQVEGILDTFGWETEDMGSVESARAIEPLCMLWCIPGLQNNRWTHAFKLLKK
ncbi:NAD(P)-binding domain-containing protein [Sorangium sp. So ce269]